MLRAIACGMAALYNVQVEKKDRIKPTDLGPSLLSPAMRAEMARKAEETKELERKARTGEINPDAMKGGPVLLTGSMIGA